MNSMFPELEGIITPDSINNLDEIFYKIRNRELAVFVGAGMSYEIGIPTWKEFLYKLANNLNGYTPPSFISDEPEYASELKKEYEERGLDIFESIKKIIENRNLPFLSSHVYFLSNNILFCITTNFDNVFDKVIEANTNLNVTPQYYPSFKISRLTIDKLCYLHGNIFRNNNIIFTKESYEKAYKDNGYIDKLMKPVYKENSLLFIGVSFKDKFLKKIIEDTERFQDEMWNKSGPHYIFLEIIKDQEDRERYKDEKLLKEIKLKPIFYYKSGSMNEKHYNLYEALNILFDKVKNMGYADQNVL